MEVNNPLYREQGIHVISTIFTVQKGVTKILLVKRKNEPFKDMWALVGGALYNNENLEDGAVREIFEKTGIKDIEIEMFDVFGKVNRSPLKRMVAVGYIGMVDSVRATILKDTIKTSNADWFSIDDVPSIAYDHNEIVEEGMKVLKKKIVRTDILKSLYPNGFTIPEIQKVYESILGKILDRRNFRKKILNLGLISDTGREVKFEGRKPAKVYEFNQKMPNENIF